mgnify:CR=1 FL=1
MNHIWIFNGAGGRFPSGCFSTKEMADKWINKHLLTGCLTRYPIDKGFYEWAIENEFFTPKKEEHKTSKFIQKFSCAGAEHYHYEDGVED